MGAGIVNLVTAVELIRDNWQVEIYDASPDPREGAPADDYGCTWAGGNARMWTATEADCYPKAPFTIPITDGGWQVRDGAPDPAEEHWLLEHRRFGNTFADDVYRLNLRAGHGWTRLRQNEPDLFDGVGLVEPVLRLHTDPVRLAADTARQHRLGELRRALTPEELRSAHPALAHTEDQLVGAVEVEGFTLRVHDLVLRLLRWLELAGVRLWWRSRVHRILRDTSGAVTALETVRGRIRADCYVVSPGAYGGELLQGTATDGRIHGVLGVWAT
ncbi:MAG: FAD-dependent oxidoreductase, partial [Actinomycetes bacterium]